MIKKLLVLIFTTLCGLGIWYALYQREELVNHRKVTSGIVEQVEYTSKSVDYFVSYKFTADGKIFHAKSSIPYAKFNDIVFLNSILKGRVFPVIYQKDNVNNSRMLFTKKDYKEFNISIPEENKITIECIDSLLKASK